MYRYILRILYVLLLAIFMRTHSSCKKLIEVENPIASMNGEDIFNDEAAAIGVLTGIYEKMSINGPTSYGTSISSFLPFFCGLSADEYRLYNTSNTQHIAYYTNAVLPDNYSPFWVEAYNVIYITNSVIEAIPKSTIANKELKNQLLGEAKFMRAYCYFYLTNLFGDIPLILKTDYKANNLVGQALQSDVYQQIIKDLMDAKNLLTVDFVNITAQTPISERTSPTKWAAASLLARVYLYIEEYDKAVVESSAVINQSQFSLTNVDETFLANSSEAIWQLQPVTMGRNTEDARVYVLTGAPDGQHPVGLNPSLISKFELGDKRFNNWIGSIEVNGTNYYFPHKYKVIEYGQPVSEYTMILRLAEQYLIRAESRIKQGEINKGIDDLNFLRMRARILATQEIPNPLPPLPYGLEESDAMEKVAFEREFEFFAEGGHRWLDLKRTNKVDNVMAVETPLKGGKWNSFKQLYPIPSSDILCNQNLKQNNGY